MGELSESELKDLAQRQAAGGPQPGEIYRHHNGGLYVIVCRSIDESSMTPLVTYRSNAKGFFWTRTLRNFTEQVDHKLPYSDDAGSSVWDAAPRFQRVLE